jgi:glutamate-1-semialdehyde 2,1-aminomutase
VNFCTGKITDYESFMEQQDMDLCQLAWIYNINRGVVMAPGREEEWTLSVAHNDEDIDRWTNALEDLLRDVTR